MCITCARKIASRYRRVDAETIARLQYIRVISGAIYLLLAPLPLGLVDSIDPVLHLHHQASVLRDRPGEIRVVEETLSRLERHGPIHAIAAIKLVGLLVGVDIKLDTRPGGLQAGDETAVSTPVIGTVLFTVDQVASVCYSISESLWKGKMKKINMHKREEKMGGEGGSP